MKWVAGVYPNNGYYVEDGAGEKKIDNEPITRESLSKMSSDDINSNWDVIQNGLCSGKFNKNRG